jgi:hypothetical protein
MLRHRCAHEAGITDTRSLYNIMKPCAEAVAELLFPSGLAVQVRSNVFLNFHPMLVGAC